MTEAEDHHLGKVNQAWTILSETARILTLAVDSGQAVTANLRARVIRDGPVIDDPSGPYKVARPTGGYDIEIHVEPPS
jgi:hypothetical protein